MATNRGIETAPPVDVDVRLGRCPAGWDTSAIFVANIDGIFYGDPEKTRHLRDNITGFAGYGSRMLPILGLLHTGAGNILVLPTPPDPALRAYFDGGLGLALPRVIVVETRDDESLETRLARDDRLLIELTGTPAERLDGYVTDPTMEGLAKRIAKPLVNTFSESRDANDKVRLFRFLHASDLPVFDGCEVGPGDRLTDCLDALRGLGYRRAIIRASLGASGFGMLITELTDPAPARMPDFVSDNEVVLVHGWVEEGRRATEEILSPSVQFFCHGRDRATIFDVTEQLLSRYSVHEGNVSPPRFALAPGHEIYDELMRQARRVTAWVAGTGYRGTGSIDFLVFRMNARLHVHVCEVNARVTGATYPSLLARHFRPDGAWLMRNFGFGDCLDVSGAFAVLESNDILYTPGADTGVLPINFITAADGRVTKAQLLFLADHPDACRALTERFVRVMPPRCVYDRD